MIYGLIEKCGESGSLKYNIQALYTEYIFRHNPKFHCKPYNGFGKTTENLINYLFKSYRIANPTEFIKIIKIVSC